ncbi:DUF2971 domain-containing protein [Hufsiella ginkgonis]|uniref:DUF2971 domain-containing protein n=1 Tax=Hufsiella ginkgonis TaxID=2695274 RepID=A0A7K1XU88_9SPHI|nr:DUF2971 domain-containing protein [Hufsiella ginkgonis]MXV14329.1 DUF2971 domain-containing protein [Hufsiella ginkgonis]
MAQRLLYKYRSLNNFKNFVDIILRNRLYASLYKETNDPMEGQYYYYQGNYDRRILRIIRENKQNVRVCSLSRNNNNKLMWSHYADGQRGVAIGVMVDSDVVDLRPIIYEGLHHLSGEIDERQAARTILIHKLNIWTYEEEERIFLTEGVYVPAEVVQIITGRVMSSQDFSMIRDLVNQINPRIEVIRAEQVMDAL